MATDKELFDTVEELEEALARAKKLSDEELQAVIARADATVEAWEREDREIEEEIAERYPEERYPEVKAAAAPRKRKAAAPKKKKKGKATAAPKRAVAAPIEAAAPTEAAAREETAAPSEVTVADEPVVEPVVEPAVKTAPAPRERRQTTVPKNLQIDMKVDHHSLSDKKNKPTD